jgi:D-alanyl-D-alanine carboxypeptidase
MRKPLRWLLLALSLCALAALGVFALRPHYWFFIKQSAFVFANEVAVAEVNFAPEALEAHSAQALMADERVTVNDALTLVRNDLPLPCGYAPSLVNYKDTTLLMHPDAAQAFARLADAVRARFDSTLYIRSAYRTQAQQAAILSDGGDALEVCQPGASEHHTGLALDVYVRGFAGHGFIQSPEGQFVNARCYEYGFIVRYPQGKSDITGIAFEPWHLRYVGKPHAEIIYKNNLTLEEYLQSLDLGRFYAASGVIISRQQGDALTLPKGLTNITLSDDGRDNYLITGVMP